MLNNIIKIFFVIVGAVTGYSAARAVLLTQNIGLSSNAKLSILIISALVLASAFYFSANRFIAAVLSALDRLERFIQGMTLYELSVSAVGLIVGLIIANLITIPISRIDIIGLPLALIANILFGCLGIGIAIGKKNESFFDPKRHKKSLGINGELPKLLDTCTVIDGRIVDICRAGFLEGDLVIPGFVLEELRHIADSPDSLKRNRGRRGLDILNMLQKDLNRPVRIENIEIEGGEEVDDKLIIAAKKLKCKIVTIDYNLNKVAAISGVEVLNVNELANAVKPIALPGEEMVVQIIKDGKENGQGIGYLEDGTMIVVEGGRKYIGETLSVVVTSILQTAAGRMIFAKPKAKAGEAAGAVVQFPT